MQILFVHPNFPAAMTTSSVGRAVLEAKENRELAELDAERARAALPQRTLRSPVTGVITERLLSCSASPDPAS
jgi:multidrug resistance efflux pump